jgi:recombination protein RecR
MMQTIDPLKAAIIQLKRFPGVGERSATRLVYWLLRQAPHVAAEIGSALIALPAAMIRCTTCGDVSAVDPCPMCTDVKREPGILCVVERPQDVKAIEAAAEFRGRYHVLGGAIAPLDGVGPDQLNISSLLARVGPENVVEVIIATDPDVEGDATALYLAKLLGPLDVRVTRLAHGISVGTEIEYADRSSVARAITNRQEM